jgi:hypothetical protein
MLCIYNATCVISGRSGLDIKSFGCAKTRVTKYRIGCWYVNGSAVAYQISTYYRDRIGSMTPTQTKCTAGAGWIAITGKLHRYKHCAGWRSHDHSAAFVCCAANCGRTPGRCTHTPAWPYSPARSYCDRHGDFVMIMMVYL